MGREGERTTSSEKYTERSKQKYESTEKIRKSSKGKWVFCKEIRSWNLFISDFVLHTDLEYEKQLPELFNERRIGHIFFADDLNLMALTPAAQQKSLDKLRAFCALNHLNILVEKTVSLQFDFQKGNIGNERPTFYVDGVAIRQVNSATYIGITYKSGDRRKTLKYAKRIEKKAKRARGWEMGREPKLGERDYLQLQN